MGKSVGAWRRMAGETAHAGTSITRSFIVLYRGDSGKPFMTQRAINLSQIVPKDTRSILQGKYKKIPVVQRPSGVVS
jgi:hypothetical protein